MHLECAQSYITNFSYTCSICRAPIKTRFLKRLPPATDSDLDEEENLLIKRRKVIATQCRDYAGWRRTVWPHVARVLRVKRVDTQVAIMTIARDAATQNALVQCMMDAGVTRRDADRVIVQIAWTSMNYDTLSLSVRRVLKRGFRQRERVAYALP